MRKNYENKAHVAVAAKGNRSRYKALQISNSGPLGLPGVVCGDHSKALQPRHKRPSVGTAAHNSLNHDKIMLATSCGFSTDEK
jgi:hypothetical protein